MGASGGFPIDIILFGMIAAFLVLRLKSILGRRTGYERPAQPVPPREAPATAEAAQAVNPAPMQRSIPEPDSARGEVLPRMAAIDRTFAPDAFLSGAEKAFRMIVAAFAAGDRVTLQPLLGDETWHAFDAAIAAREKEGHVQITEIRSIHAMGIEAAELNGNTASITVRIVSDQVNMTQTKSGQVVTGTDAVTEINDLWTFERDLTHPNPAWHLISARSA